MADVTTKLLFASCTNCYTASEAKALLAVIAVKKQTAQDKGHTALCFLQWQVSCCCRGHTGTRVSWVRQGAAPWVNFCPSTCWGARQGRGTQLWSLVLQFWFLFSLAKVRMETREMQILSLHLVVYYILSV